ncbi:MAG: S9 family peptidase [Hyphomonadaceae bacterium]|nr:S9 family peptidase [Hyphomonadaceae bacterium]
MTEKPKPLQTRREPKRIEQLGRVRTDDYAWLKDDNWQAVMRDPSLLKPEIRAHLEAENAYTKQMMAGTEALQEKLYQELRGRIKEDDSSVPAPDGPYAYYRRFAVGGQHPIYARTPRDGGAEEILLDVDALARGKAYYKVVSAEHSPDHALFAYAADEQGSEVYTIYVKDLASGALLEHAIASTTGDFTFSPCGAYIFWTHRNANGRSDKIYRRPARGGEDVLIYDEPDEGFFIGVGVSESRAFILINAGNHSASEWCIIPASDPTAAPRLFAAREDDILYTPTHWNGRWVVLTNADDAVDFKIVECSEADTSRASWRDLIPYEPGRFITQLHASKDYLIRLERAQALPRIVLRDGAGEEHAIALSEQAYNLELVGSYEYDTPIQRYIYQSPTTPRQWFDYDMAARTQVLRKTQEVPSGHDPAKYETRRLFATAPDGVAVPITVLMLRGQKLDGSAPMLLYGYGSYGISIDADFSITPLTLVDRGWVHAIAHVRGGSELGFGWFLDGRLEKRPNTFTDFIACAELLIAQGYGRAGNIVTEGRSAGGMLMGAITNMRPDLWAGVIGGVPFVDVLNTMSDASLPLTPPEWPEWGNPLESAEDYDRIAAYSPYDNISPKPYPAVLSTGGLTDPRVTYWEPTKWAAKLREFTTSDRPILLKMIMTAGHAGSAGRFEHLREIAHDYAFALRAVGAEEAGAFP